MNQSNDGQFISDWSGYLIKEWTGIANHSEFVWSNKQKKKSEKTVNSKNEWF